MRSIINTIAKKVIIYNCQLDVVLVFVAHIVNLMPECLWYIQTLRASVSERGPSISIELDACYFMR